ncbi:MAG: class I SAM-dependent methyltransferase [Gemmatimonadetes bacterium]|nr:class I SAM-dependent methyltransferase [Gemmatimonadota bacterium]NIR80599.1 class I SAM-dependent methyltransferase [Gemmatimonadota bacterium]NIT89364.1 class I SAM-dependent methyltransferase [Gemmatimonadota bacterium]NIU33170.1 class I SAM-dependent methyltransferase [Gemmatimonadota bacterium]NIV63522.1 methyltransferase domain-containing protein [Gemmatimonadota bacterium]
MSPGERDPADRTRWDARYRDGDWSDERHPARIVEDAERWLPREGLALDVACGAGRNALYLAERGLRVLGVDLSREGLRLLERRARDRSLPVQGVLADLSRFALRPGRFDVVVSTHCLLREAFPLIRDALAPGGLLLFETYHVDELDVLGGDIRRAFALEPGELRRAFPELEILLYEEGVFQREEGERGLARMVGRRG